MSNSPIKQRADAQFKKPPWVEDDNSAQSTYEAAADALAAKIARLKELRLARDAAERAAPPQAIAAKKPAKKAANKVSSKKQQKERPGVSLADWLKSRQAVANT